MTRLRLAGLCAACLAVPSLNAAPAIWTGAANSTFADPANWSASLPPADDLVTDLATFSGPPAHKPALAAPRSVAGLVFATPSGGWTLSAADPAHALSLGASGLDASAQSSGTTTLSAALVLAATQTWSIGATGTVLATGSVRLGSSATPLAAQLVIGGSSSGDLVLDPAPTHSVQLFANLASVAALQVNRRLVLGSAPGSTSSVNTIHNTASSGIRVSTTGVLAVRSGEWRTNDLGSNNTAAFTGTLDISGGILATGGARYLGQFNGPAATTINLSGGSLVVTSGGHSLANSGHLGLGAHGAGTPTGTITFNFTGGTLEIAKGAGNFPAGSGIASAALSLGGVANTSVLLDQSGGLARVGVAPGAHVFTGAPNANTYSHLSIGSAFAANRAAYTLSGGQLLVAGTVQGVASGSGGMANFNFLGGTLSPAVFDATALGHSPSATANSDQLAASASLGTLVNRGGALAPGGLAVPGRTAITGGYSVASPSASLVIDLGDPSPATAFQHLSPSAFHDTVAVSGPVTLGGDLVVNVLPGFTPSATTSFTVLSAPSGLTGDFANAPSGSRVLSADGLHTFLVTRTATAVVLSDYRAVLAPTLVSATSPSVLAEGDAVLLGVSASSLAPVTYAWSRDGILLPDATSSTLALLNFQLSDAGLYSVTVRNAAGSFTRDFLVRVTTPPSSVSVVLNAATSSAFTAAPGAVSYQWILDGEPVATTPSFTYAPARREVGTHWLRVVETYADNSVVTRHWAVRVRLPVPASALAFHVAPAPVGSDSAPGTLAAPFATLEKARDAIRLLSPAQRAGGVTVFLRGGIHRRTTTFVLSAQDSGTESAPVIYAAFPGETPVLTSTRVLTSAQWSPLASTEHARVAPGVDVSRLWEASVSGNPRAAAHPAVFNEWIIFNALRSSQNGGLLEVFRSGERQPLSRYPNAHPTDDTLTPSLLMDGVATGAASDGTAHLNGAGTYTRSDSTTAVVGGAFHYSAADADRVARWQTALDRGGLWLAGYWRVPWQLNGVRVGLIDPAKRVIGLVPNPSNAASALVSGGVGDKYARPAGSKKEPWFALNLLEEIDVPGEWSIDFSRQRLYLLLDRDGPPADSEIELADQSSVLFQLNGASDVVLRGLTFRRHLGINVQILNNASRNLVLACRFIQSGNMAVDINGGVSNGVLSSDFDQLASGGVMLRGGSLLPDGTPVPADHFAVNNKFRSFGEVVRVYQAAIDVGYGGPMGSWGLPTVGMHVAHNDVRTSPHAGILWNGHRHVIEYNEVSDFTRISNDLGAIYRFGRNADFRTVIRYNHLHDSPLGEGVYNDMDHVRTPVYGNTVNLKTPASAQRGYGFWSNTHTATGEANTALPMGLQVFNNVFVNTRSGASFHSATGGRIENNLSYRPLGSPFLWYRITNNTTTNTHVVSTSNAATLQSGPNLAYASDPGFVAYADDDLRLRPDASVYRDLPGFVPVPLELAGLRPDETRAADPAVRVWSPFVVTGSAASVGTTTATFTGTLVYPQFDANAVVRIRYGTTDGGTDPAAWQHVAVLGQPGSGHLSHLATGLAPGTRYYFRFHAENAAGEHWAERGNFTTTFLTAVTPDTTGPVLITPGDIVLSGGSTGAVATFEVSAEDALSGYATAVATPPSGSVFPLGSTTVTVTASDAAGNTSTATFTVTVQPPSLPAPFTLRQIKPYSGIAPGTVEVLSPTSFRIIGRGGASTGGATADLWTGTNDSHTYVSLPWQGDGVFTARVVSLASTDASAKAGLIFRETTDAGSRYSSVYVLRSNGGAVNTQHKTATNGSSTNVNFFTASSTNRGLPEWIRLVRQGDTFSTFHSEDGATWTQLSTARVNVMGGSALTVGLCVVPRTGGTEATAVFDNLSFLTPHQLWRQTHFGTTEPVGTAAPLADANADGLPNLLAYALNLSPLAATSTAPLALDLVQTDESAATHLTVAFNRIADPTLTYVVDATSDLITWTPIWTSTGSANQPGEVIVADPVEQSPTHPRRFLRLRVTAP